MMSPCFCVYVHACVCSCMCVFVCAYCSNCTCVTASASCSSCKGDTYLQCVVSDSGNWCFSPSHCMTDCVDVLRHVHAGLSIRIRSGSNPDWSVRTECILILIRIACALSQTTSRGSFDPDRSRRSGLVSKNTCTWLIAEVVQHNGRRISLKSYDTMERRRQILQMLFTDDGWIRLEYRGDEIAD